MANQGQTYISPIKLFNQKAYKTCEAYRKAKNKLSACYSCKLERCKVPEGNFTPTETAATTEQPKININLPDTIIKAHPYNTLNRILQSGGV